MLHLRTNETPVEHYSPAKQPGRTHDEYGRRNAENSRERDGWIMLAREAVRAKSTPLVFRGISLYENAGDGTRGWET